MNIYSNTSNTSNRSLTLVDIDYMKKFICEAGEEPFAAFMRKIGAPPEQWTLILPEKMKQEIIKPAIWPSYVRFSALLESPVVIRLDFFPKIEAVMSALKVQP